MPNPDDVFVPKIVPVDKQGLRISSKAACFNYIV
jgi:hypothetical protein